MKASADRSITDAWNAEALTRQKNLKPLQEYLKPQADKSPDTGAGELRAMIARMANKQGGAHGHE